MKVYALGIRRGGEIELAGEPALNMCWDVVEKVRVEVQQLDDTIVKHFPGQQPKEFVVLEAEPGWAVVSG
ncbi:hypothetical protein [Pseudonocardia sp. NPDC049154]|uniref:hypothetical protein n=1 Tax=Pseudonocardia sp. NPDC049154 TaxID=3155501 RepID=UPI00340BF4BD